MRILLFADSHLGFDLPVRPRIKRRRRGHDFLANHRRVAERALQGDIDLVVHGGDVFHRSRVVRSLVHQAFEPLHRVADHGIPVFVVPGNHERSRIPHVGRARHPGLHIFDRPRTVVVEAGGIQMGVSGFPYVRRHVRTQFTRLVHATGWHSVNADARILCIHHCVEGATVGPADYVFRGAADVIRGVDLPKDFAAILSGHIHRHQVLDQDPDGRHLPAPVFYPGSIERTSVAEADEVKGYVVLDVEPSGDRGSLQSWRFNPLPTRPMVVRSWVPSARARSRVALDAWIDETISEVADDAVLRLRIAGPLSSELAQLLSASEIRRRAPATMNVEWSYVDAGGRRKRPSPDRVNSASDQLSFLGAGNRH